MQMIRRLFPFAMMGIPLMAANAVVAPPATANAVSTITSCRNIASDTDRLACYDHAAAALDVAVAHHDITVLDKEEVHRTRRTLFGFSLPNLAVFGIGDKSETDKSPDLAVLDTTLRSVRAVSYGKWDMETEEHAVWRNVDLLDFAPTAGEKVHIKKGVMGSFFLKLDSDRAVRAERVH